MRKEQEQRAMQSSEATWSSGGTSVTLSPTLDDHSRPESPGVAVASITIEDVSSSRDYEINDNGIVRLRKGSTVTTAPAVHPDYEYEYYEADPDEVQFPAGGTRRYFIEIWL